MRAERWAPWDPNWTRKHRLGHIWDDRLHFIDIPRLHGWDRRWFLRVRLGAREVPVWVLAQTFITSSPGSNQTISKPIDWDDLHNSVEGIGAGASGGAARNTGSASGYALGGTGGSYQIINNFAWPGSTATARVGAGGAAVVRSTSGATAGNPGGDTWFNSTAFPTTGDALGAGGGLGGPASSNSANASGGAQGAVYPATGGALGGKGGSVTSSQGGSATGGGGAGGPNGAGNQGAAPTGTNQKTNGGSGDAGAGGAGGINAGPGGAGSEFTTAGAGGGGAANTGNTSDTIAGDGGLSGGAGGGVLTVGGGTATSGRGESGIIVLTWTPLIPVLGNQALYYG